MIQLNDELSAERALVLCHRRRCDRSASRLVTGAEWTQTVLTRPDLSQHIRQ